MKRKVGIRGKRRKIDELLLLLSWGRTWRALKRAVDTESSVVTNRPGFPLTWTQPPADTFIPFIGISVPIPVPVSSIFANLFHWNRINLLFSI
ncbi:hypothetical protein SLA2020_176380 [Shorea laevis]